MDDMLDTLASPVNGQHGTTDTALLVRFRDGTTIPVGVQTGRCAREYLDVYNTDGAIVVGVRRGGVTRDLLSEPRDLLSEAHRRLLNDPVLRYRAELTARVMKRLRTDDVKTILPGLEDDRVIAAVALVVSQLPERG